MLEVGSVTGRLGFKVDDTGANRYERKLNELRGKASKDIVADARVDVDRKGVDAYQRQLRGVEQQSARTERATKSHGGALMGLGRTAAMVAGPAALLGVAAVGRSVFQSFKESEQVGRQTNAVLKSTGGEAGVTAKQVGDLANAISRKTGIDDEAIQSGENLLLTFTNVKNEAGAGNDIFNQTTAIMTDMSAALGQDTKSSAIQLGKALNDPVKGVTALQRVGVSFTKSQKEQIKGLVEHGKTLDAQKLILRELNKEFGGSAAATATSSKRLGVTLGNVGESIGKVISPVIEKVAKGLDTFINGMLKGEGAGGKFVAVLKGLGSVIGTVARGIGQGFGIIRNAFGGGDAQASKLGGNLRRTFNGIASTVRSVVNSITRQFRTMGPELETIARAVGRVIDVLLAIFRRMLPAVRAIWEGIARVIRGVVEVIAGILSGDFGKIAEGFKHILSGLVKAAGGIIRELTAPFREVMSRIGKAVSGGLNSVVGFFSRLPGRIGNALAGLPGKLAGIGKSAVGAFGRALSGLPGAIGQALKGGGQFIGDIGRSIADWINAHTPLGDNVKIGPLKVHLPALAQGGKPGNVGPSHGGARVFIAGEGNADEWVISQEGDRRQNVNWAREALESLTGRRVELHKGGKGKKHSPPKPKLSAGQLSGMARSVGHGEAGIKNFERDIARLERLYAQKDREYGMSVEEYVIENDDGTASLDQGQLDQRLGELRGLHSLRSDVTKKVQAYKTAVGNVSGIYATAKGRLSKALSRAKGSKRAKERSGYRDRIAAYQTRINELADLAKDLDLDLGDQALDMREIESEATSLDPQHAGALLPPPPTPDAPAPVDEPEADTGGGGGGDSGTTTGADGTVIAPPSPEDIAAAAVAQVQAFQSARAELFGDYGANFIAAGSRPSESMAAAGARYFGGGADYAGEGGAGAPQVTQIITFPTPPTDPHGWTAASLHELQAAL